MSGAFCWLPPDDGMPEEEIRARPTEWGKLTGEEVGAAINGFRANSRQDHPARSFRKISREFSPSLRQIIEVDWRISSVLAFLKIATPEKARAAASNREISSNEYRVLIEIWVEARTTILGREHAFLPERFFEIPPTTVQKEKTMDQQVNPDRNEMIALLQGAKGMQFVAIQMNFSRLVDEDDDARPKSRGPLLTYKALDLDLKPGDVVVVQYRERFGIGRVAKVFSEAPTSDQYDYRLPLRHVVQKIDVTRSAQLEALDHSMLKKITASEAQDRLERMTRQLGISLDDVSLTLPAPETLEGDDL